MDDIARHLAGFLTETPLEAVAQRIQERVVIGERTFVIWRPADSHGLLDHPAIQSAFATDDYMPYWADLWPGAYLLAKALVCEKWESGLEALELGCGLGLAGITALSHGLRVTFSDYDATALRFAADNARANGFHKFRLLQLDWRCPPTDLQFPFIFGADLIYEMRNAEPLAALIQRMLAPGGVCLLTDPDRPPAQFFCKTLTRTGVHFTTKVIHAGEPGETCVRGTLYRVTHSG
jgi:predicted nicotinamide N-methyase